MREMARVVKHHRKNIRERLADLAAWIDSKKIIEKEMTEEECRRVVKKLARRAIATRARAYHRAGMRPTDALARARAEYKSQFGGFR